MIIFISLNVMPDDAGDRIFFRHTTKDARIRSYLMGFEQIQNSRFVDKRQPSFPLSVRMRANKNIELRRFQTVFKIVDCCRHWSIIPQIHSCYRTHPLNYYCTSCGLTIFQNVVSFSSVYERGECLFSAFMPANQNFNFQSPLRLLHSCNRSWHLSSYWARSKSWAIIL